MELSRESKRIKKLREDAKKPSVEEQIKIKAEKAKAEKEQQKL